MWRSVVLLCSLARAVVCSCLPGSWQRRSLSRPCLVVCSCACVRTSCDGQSVRARNAKYGPYLQIQKYLGPYFAVFTVKKTKYTPPNAHLAAPKFVFDGPGERGGERVAPDARAAAFTCPSPQCKANGRGPQECRSVKTRRSMTVAQVSVK